MAYIDQLMATVFPQSVGFTAIPETADAEALAAEEARQAAARRLQRGVRSNRFGGSDISGLLDLGSGTMGGGPAGLSIMPSSVAPNPVADPAVEVAPRGPAVTSPEFAGVPGRWSMPSADLPPDTNDPESGQPQVYRDGQPVPLPQPRPDMESPPNAKPAAGPMQLPQRPQQRNPFALGGGGFMDKLLDPSTAPALLALAGGFAGAPSIGTGMRRAFSAASMPAEFLRRSEEGKVTQREIVESLTGRGVPLQEAIAASKSPQLMQALVAKYFETKAPINVNGVLVQPKADGSYQVVADFSEMAKPPQGFKKNPDGTFSFIKGGPADPAYKREAGERQSAPPGYRYVNPADPSSDLVAIPGGPAEKVDANVAARLGLAESFLDQLPSIRKRINTGEATGPLDAALAKLGVGGAGELRRQIQSGAEALLRNLTGAGMNIREAENYVQRYELTATDTVQSMNSKLNQLERELRTTIAAVGRGRGGTHASTATAKPNVTTSGITWSLE